MNHQVAHTDALNEQKHTAKMVWLVVAIGMPLVLSVILYITSPIFLDNGVVNLAYVGTLAVIGLPVYGYLVWFFRKKYKLVVADLENPQLETVHSELQKLSRRYDDDSGVDHYIATFRNGLKCRVKTEVAKRLNVSREYGIVHFIASKSVFEIKSDTNKTLISSKNIIR